MKETYTKEEVLKLLEEQKRICAETCEDSFYYGSILNSPLATGESNYVVIEKEKLFLLIPSMYWAGMLTKEGQEHLLEQFGIDLK